MRRKYGPRTRQEEWVIGECLWARESEEQGVGREWKELDDGAEKKLRLITLILARRSDRPSVPNAEKRDQQNEAVQAYSPATAVSSLEHCEWFWRANPSLRQENIFRLALDRSAASGRLRTGQNKYVRSPSRLHVQLAVRV